MSIRPTCRLPLLGAAVSAALIASSLAAAPANAAFTPTKTSSVTIDVDGTTLGIDSSVSDMSSSRSGVFGGGNQPSGSSPDAGDLTEMYAAKDGAFVNFEARGGVVAVTCSGSGTLYYRRAQVTIGNLPSGTNDVWVLSDASVGPRVGPTPQFNDRGTMMSASSTSGSPTLTGLANTSSISVGDQVNGPGIPAGTTVAAIPDGTTITLSANATTTTTGNVQFFTERIGTTSGLQSLCDGTTPYIAGATGTTATAGVLTMGDSSASPSSTARDTAGVVVNNTTATSVSFDIYVPTNGGSSGATENFIALGIVVDAGGDGTLDDSTADTAIFTHVVSKPWDTASDVLLSACSSPAASDSACYVAADTGVFQSDGTTRVGGGSDFSVVASFYSQSGEAIANAVVGFTSAHSSGFSIPANAIVKFSMSLPTTGTVHGIDFAANRMTNATGQTGLLVDPRTTSPSSATNRWDVTTVSDRDIASVTGIARATSSAISRSAWYSNCQISFSGSSVSTVGCGEGMTSSVSTDYLVFTTVPADFSLAVIDDPIMRTVAGGFVSTNAQNLNFGPETMTGTSFQFAVAGPSYDSNDNARTTDGYYYVCVPSAFLSGSFSTTPADAASSWIGTRDGSTVSTSFSTGTCGISTGLVAYLDPFGYSAPVFSLRPPSTPTPSSGSSGSSAATDSVPSSSTASTSESASSVATAVTATSPAVVPSIYPQLALGKTVKKAYLARLAASVGTMRKGTKVRISIPKMFRSTCQVRKGKVVGLAPGVCGVKVKLTDAKGKVRVKRVYLTIS